MPEKFSSGAGAAVKWSAAGTEVPAETNEPAGLNELVVVNGPAGKNGPVEKPACCCSLVYAEADQADGPAGAGARAGAAEGARLRAGPDEAAANGIGTRRR